MVFFLLQNLFCNCIYNSYNCKQSLIKLVIYQISPFKSLNMIPEEKGKPNQSESNGGSGNGQSKGSDILTTRQGHPVSDNQNLRTVGNRGPATLENYQFLEKMSHFDRERVPERVVHARGAGAHGYFEAYGNIPGQNYSRKKVKEHRHSFAFQL
jgi:hypothetical protein